MAHSQAHVEFAGYYCFFHQGPKRREEKTNVPDPAVPLDQELEFIDENMQTPTSITENVNPNSATPMDLRVSGEKSAESTHQHSTKQTKLWKQK